MPDAGYSDGRIQSVNIAHVRPNPFRDASRTGIDKRSVDVPVMVRAPGPMLDGLGSGLVGDFIGDRSAHGGDDQAVYAYTREDLDEWESRLGRELASGSFGENLTTVGLDVNGARIGERWRIGADLVLEVTGSRVPCATFRGWMDRQGWLREFTLAAIPGAYLRVLAPGEVRTGDAVVVSDRPPNAQTVADEFRAEMGISSPDPARGPAPCDNSLVKPAPERRPALPKP
ncbi:MAG: MOSC domain-containing protein [Actinomycetes bacterium]